MSRGIGANQERAFHVKHEAGAAIWLLRDQARAWGVELTSAQVCSLGRYASLLAGYKQANVTGTTDAAVALLDHVADSLSCFLTSRIANGTRLIDVGSGGGLPGLPLRLARTGLQLVLLEATAKKARFLEQSVDTLGLSGIGIMNQRAEAVGRIADCRDSFDIAVARAVAELPVVVEYCAPLLRPGGRLIAMKAGMAPDELSAGTEAADALSAEFEEVYKVTFLPDMVQKERRLVVFRKKAATPERFPRRIGLAKQKPLGYGGGR